jgi:hypothetical protein
MLKRCVLLIIAAYAIVCGNCDQCKYSVEINLENLSSEQAMATTKYPNGLRFDLNPQQIADLAVFIIENTKKVNFVSSED